MPEEDRTENFDQIHSMGKKNTKYMKFHPSRAPLVDRTACKYHQEFTRSPWAIAKPTRRWPRILN